MSKERWIYYFARFAHLSTGPKEYMHIDMFIDPWIIYVSTKIPVHRTDNFMPIFPT